MSFYQSLYTAECLTLLEAVQIAVANPLKKYIEFSDSLSALTTLERPKMGIKINPHILEIKRLIVKNPSLFNKERRLQFYWLPSHIGISGNERAGIGAKYPTTRPFIDAPLILYTDLKEHFNKKAHLNSMNKSKNESETKGSYYYERFFLIAPNPGFTIAATLGSTLPP